MESSTKRGTPKAGRNQLDTEKGDKRIDLMATLLRQALEYEDLLKGLADQTYAAVRKVRTTDGTATQIWSSTIPATSAWDMEWTVVGYSEADTYAAYKRVTRIKYDGTTATESTDTIATDREDVGAWTTTIAATAAGVVSITVTGAASTTVDWTCRVVIQEARSGQ